MAGCYGGAWGTRSSRQSWNAGEAAMLSQPHDMGNSTGASHRWRHRTATAVGVDAGGAGRDSTAACRRPRGSRTETRVEGVTETWLARPTAENSEGENIS